MTYQIEHTDTFGDEANYSWVNRCEVTPPPGADVRRWLIRRAKALARLTGVRCDVDEWSNGWCIRPRGLCQVVFITWAD